MNEGVLLEAKKRIPSAPKRRTRNIFYLGMKALVSEKMGKAKLDDIIKEEMIHIRLLAGKLSEYY